MPRITKRDRASYDALLEWLEADYALDTDESENETRYVRDPAGALLRSLGFRYLDEGCWKEVFVSDQFPGIVLKRAKTRDAECFREAENWHTAPEEVRPFLLPLITHSEHFQVQRRIKFRSCGPRCRARRGLLPMYDCGSNNHTHDARGRLVIVDYGQDDMWEDAA